MPTSTSRGILFLSSYSPLFLILAVRDSFDHAVLSIVLVGLSVASVGFLVVFLRAAEGMEPLLTQPISIRPTGMEAMGYIVTYIIPFLDIDLGCTGDVVSLGILLVLLGVLYVNSDLIYVNPILNLLGYHVFEVSTGLAKPSALITRRGYIPQNEELRVISLGNYVVLEKNNDGR